MIHYVRWSSSREAAYRDQYITRKLLLSGGFDTADERRLLNHRVALLLEVGYGC